MKIWQLFFTIAVCLGCTSVSQARLGQSKTECMKHYTQGGYRLSDDQWYFLTDEGFKKAGKEISANIGGARIERIMFVNKARLNVFVELFKDKVVRVIYEHQVEKLDYQMLSAFLDANKEKGCLLYTSDAADE